MSSQRSKNPVCVIIGASHAGVNCAFALRREGYAGNVVLIDADPHLPYHRPPLSKSFLTQEDGLEKIALRPAESYDKENIVRKTGKVTAIDRQVKQIKLADGSTQSYDQLVIATGARPLIPTIPGIETTPNVFALRQVADIQQIRQALDASSSQRVLIIGGGYIGLELAASLTKLAAKVQVLEREDRILARVTAPAMSQFFHELHQLNGVAIHTRKNVVAIHPVQEGIRVECADASQFEADIIVLGVGIKVNVALAATCGLTIENGIQVDTTTRTSDQHIYAIGDCSYHYNAHYGRFVRLESVQNAVDQAKVAAANICGKETYYEAMPWFWSDQYDVKLQTVGLFNGYDEAVLRQEVDKHNCFSIWYFKANQLIAVDAVNNAKAYVVGMKLLKAKQTVDISKVANSTVPLKPALLVP